MTDAKKLSRDSKIFFLIAGFFALFGILMAAIFVTLLVSGTFDFLTIAVSTVSFWLTYAFARDARDTQ